MDNKPEGIKTPPEKTAQRPRMNPASLWLVLVLLMVLGLMFFGRSSNKSELPWPEFYSQLEKGNIDTAVAQGMTIRGEFKLDKDNLPPINPNAKPKEAGAKSKEPVRFQKEYTTTIPMFVLQDPQIDTLLRSKVRDYKAEEPSDNTGLLLTFYLLVTIALFVGRLVHVPPHPRPVHGRRHSGRLQQEPRQALRDGRQAGHLRRRGRAGRRQERAGGGRRVPQEPREVPAARRPGAQGRAADGPAGHGQDAAGPGRGRRGGRALLLDQRLRVHPDVRRRGRQPRARPVRHRQGERPLRSSSSTRSTPWAATAGPGWAADTTNASRRSTRSSARWTASPRTSR